MDIPKRYSVIRISGKADTFDPARSYYDVLGAVYMEHQSAGSVWDRPHMLIYGDAVVVERGLTDVAWKYGKQLYQAKADAVKAVQDAFAPTWIEREPRP